MIGDGSPGDSPDNPGTGLEEITVTAKRITPLPWWAYALGAAGVLYWYWSKRK